MFNLFKKEENKPYTYSSIEMRQSSNKSVWILAILIGFVIIAILLFSNQRNSSQVIPLSTSTPTPTSISQASPSATSNLTLGKKTKTSGCVSVNGLPDKECTPGDIDPRVTQDNIQSTICVSGYTKTVRPTVSYTNNLKIKQIQEYGYQDTSLKDYEEDHLISLELGGSPTSEANLWPEPYTITNNAREKDKVENYLHDQICAGKITLQQAQLQIANDWEEIYKTIF